MGAFLAFVTLAGVQLALVAAAGTDIPFHDQWDVEGAGALPAIRNGTFAWRDYFTPHNEHRILWTHGLNWILLTLNGGQWDPLVQLIANAFLHAAAGASLVWFLIRGQRSGIALLAATAVTLALAPVPGWHNALWGFQSQVYWVQLFAILAIGLFAGGEGSSVGRALVSGLLVVLGLFAMGAGLLIPAALLTLTVLRWRDRRPLRFLEAGMMTVLLVFGWTIRTDVPAHAVLHASGTMEFLAAWARIAAWPHVDQPVAALVLNLPLAIAGVARWRGVLAPRPAVDLVLALGLFGLAVSLATAWVRGGGDEFVAGVPSRYADLVVFLPLANAACVFCLLSRFDRDRVRRFRWIAMAWLVFLVVGWVGLSAEALRRVVLPRVSDRDAPVRLLREFARTGDPAVFSGQPRLLVPHPNLALVQTVLADPRMEGALPPSLQPGRPAGALSVKARQFLGRE